MTYRESYIRCMRNAGRALAYLRWASRRDSRLGIEWAKADVCFWNRQAAFWRRLDKEEAGK